MTQNEPIPEAVRQQAAHWLAVREAETLTRADKQRFAAWLAASPVHRRAFAKAESVWSALDRPLLDRPNMIPRRRSWRRLQAASRRAINRRSIGGAIAAGLALAVVVGSDLTVRLRADDVTAVGEQRTVQLPDGSTVLLNTDSAIAVDSADGRLIRLLKGEAAFTVASDPRHPFTVRAASGSTTALGTRFIVRRLDGSTQVSVIQHAVRVDLNGANRRLSEGESLSYDAGGIGLARKIDIADADAWTRGRIRVVDQPLGEVVRELDRYHHGYIGVIGEDLARRPVSGTFDIADPVGAIDVIQRTLHLASTRFTDRLILIHR